MEIASHEHQPKAFEMQCASDRLVGTVVFRYYNGYTGFMLMQCFTIRVLDSDSAAQLHSTLSSLTMLSSKSVYYFGFMFTCLP